MEVGKLEGVEIRAVVGVRLFCIFKVASRDSMTADGSLYNDKILITLLREGDRAAFETIYRRYLPALYAITYKRLQHREQTEDVLQEVFARIWTGRERLQIEDLTAYLHAAVRNETINYITRSKKALAFYEPFEAIFLESDTPEGRLIARDLLDLVYAYAATLPEKKKQVFLLHVRNKLSTREIADEMGISVKTAQNQLRSALQGLKTHLAPMLAAIIASRW